MEERSRASAPAEFGTILRRFRERALQSQEQLAERSGLSIRAISNLEQGRVATPRGESVRLLADALGLGGQQRRLFEDAARPKAARASGTAAGTPPAPERLAPCQLPPDVADFTGRDKQIGWLRDLLTGAAVGVPPPAVVVSAVAGKAGVGKTALAIHVAHQLRGRFPDGQLYVNLRGAEQQPLKPPVVLAQFLRALGVDGATIPRGLDERQALYRTQLAGRRVLVVLDNAASEAQVRPLLPGSPGCAVLVTSRARLAGRGAARLVDLDVLEFEAAVELLGRIVGPERVSGEPDAAAAIVGSCGRLPLAIRIAGARLAGRPRWPLAQLAMRLDDEHRRLDQLTAGDLEVRASLALSYGGLQEPARSGFRRLGLLDAPDFPAWIAAAVSDVSPGQGEQVAEALVEAQLLEVAEPDRVGQVRYRFHDLLRLFARERAAAEEPPEQRTASLARALGGWLALAERAQEHAPDRPLGVIHGDAQRWPPSRDAVALVEADPLGWFEAERAALVLGVHQAAAAGLDELAWDLAGCISRSLETRGWYDDWAYTHRLALASARRPGNLAGEAYLLRRLGDLHMDQNRYDDAHASFLAALAVSDRLGGERDRARSVYSLGCVQLTLGRLEEASASFATAWAGFQRSGDRRGEAQALYGAGAVCQEQGLLLEALERFQASLAAFREVRERRGAAHLLRWVGSLHASLGHHDQAQEVLRECLAANQELGDRLGAAYTLGTLGEVYIGRCRLAEAGSSLDQSLSLFDQLGNQSGQAWALRTLGRLRIAQHRAPDALRHLQASVRLFAQLHMPLGQARGLMVLGDAHRAKDDHLAARQSWERALGLFEQLGVPEADQVRDRLGG